MTKWGGWTVTKARRHIAAQLPAPCWRCGRVLYADDPGSWVVGHLIERDRAPDLALNPDNWAPECRPCSHSSGARYRNAKQGRRRRRPTSRTW
jgi:5-methylcytosine-specific restriction endonuclease McrA